LFYNHIGSVLSFALLLGDSRQTSHSVSGHIDRIVTLLVKFCSVDDDELREYSLQAFETLVRRCPQETLPHINTVIEIGLKYLTHDPNYNYDDDSGGDEVMETEDDEQGLVLAVYVTVE
jgi:cullin-associated NEDD8-dissociated protein 1